MNDGLHDPALPEVAHPAEASRASDARSAPGESRLSPLCANRPAMTARLDDIDDITRIRRTWAKAAAGGDVVGTIFYKRLFELAPSARPLFADDMTEQARKLMQTLNWIIDHVDETEVLQPSAEALAVRHLRYGVTRDQYPAVGQALIETLSMGLGSAFTDADAAAWGRVYGKLSQVMIDAAYAQPNGPRMAPQ